MDRPKLGGVKRAGRPLHAAFDFEPWRPSRRGRSDGPCDFLAGRWTRACYTLSRDLGRCGKKNSGTEQERKTASRVAAESSTKIPIDSHRGAPFPVVDISESVPEI